ncbi:MAG: neutral zinc metallopeptidase [Vicinamibacterales bacterium]
MKWQSGRRSENVEDRRGMGGGMRVGGGIGLGGVLLVLLISFLTGADPLQLLGGLARNAPTQANTEVQGGAPPTDDPQAGLVSVVLADTEDVFTAVLQQEGETYQPPRLVLFSDQVQSACGFQSAAVGPFYCPGDQQVYIDLAFYRELEERFGAPGDFAQAYVIAHEVGHHVQNLLGTSQQVDDLRRRSSEEQANALSVRQELQADCYAGVWAHHSQRSGTNIQLERGDVEEGLNAAAAIGDDRIQKQTRGHIVPESFTHGSSAQRVEWFRRGLETGSLRQCDTFRSQT